MLLLIPETVLKSKKKKFFLKTTLLSNSWKKDIKTGKLQDLMMVPKETQLLRQVF